MDALKLIFASPYDQAALAVMAIGLAINAASDVARRRRARQPDAPSGRGDQRGI